MSAAPCQVEAEPDPGALFRPVSPGGPGGPWHVLWTRSHCERLVQEQVEAKGYAAFLPTVLVWSRQRTRPHRIRLPLFPGYLLLNHRLDQTSYVDVLKARGLIRVLGERWDRLLEVPAGEVEAIRRVVESNLPAHPSPFLRQGQRVRIVRGPLKDVEGFFLRGKPGKGLLVLSVELLRRSVAVEVEAALVTPA
jgi:transcription termination/antitermination protein NusG